MLKSVIISLALHVLFFFALFYSQQVSFMHKKRQLTNLSPVGVMQADLLYKPTDTPMRQGTEKRDLPPPKIKTDTPEEQRPTLPKPPPKTPAKPEPKKDPKKEAQEKAKEKAKLAKSLIDKLRQEEGLDAKKKPRDDNFPTRADGVKDARGTGAQSKMQATPAQQALQAAMRKYFELPQAGDLRKKFPDAVGYYEVSALGIDGSLQIKELRLMQSSGLELLDDGCRRAIQKALLNETFASDVIAELSGRDNIVECRF